MLFALLGPRHCGKTSTIREALALAAQRGARAAYIDLREAREVWNIDEFYAWLLGNIRQQLDASRVRVGTRGSRVAWCDSIEQLVAASSGRVLLGLDHVESIADRCALELVSDLREIQDRSLRSSDDEVWERFRCVLAGSVSVFQLRRRAKAVDLQCFVRVLPLWANGHGESAALSTWQPAERR